MDFEKLKGWVPPLIDKVIFQLLKSIEGPINIGGHQVNVTMVLPSDIDPQVIREVLAHPSQKNKVVQQTTNHLERNREYLASLPEKEQLDFMASSTGTSIASMVEHVRPSSSLPRRIIGEENTNVVEEGATKKISTRKRSTGDQDMYE